jgi:hypothetical protein
MVRNTRQDSKRSSVRNGRHAAVALVALAVVLAGGTTWSDPPDAGAAPPHGSAGDHAGHAGHKPAKEPHAKEAAHQHPAGKAEVLRQLPKKFARFVDGDPIKLEVTLHVEGEKSPTTWKLVPDAELKRHGWWARIEQFRRGQRVWVWFDLDRKKQPTGVLMLADEISEQDIHSQPLTLDALDLSTQTIALKPAKGDVRKLKITEELGVRRVGEAFEFAIRADPAAKTDRVASPIRAKLGDRLYVQTEGDAVTEVLDAAGLAVVRRQQDLWLRQRWREQGLAGSVAFLHRLGGEMEVMLDHEAIRWGRYLKAGDQVTLQAAEPIRGAVKHVTPLRERTGVRLVVSGFDQTLLVAGQRLQVKLPEPPAAVQDSELPTDIGRPRSKSERLDWFLSSVYCTCRIGGDGCTGMFYTLASCSAHNCGMPRKMRSDVEQLIDKGLTDQQIYTELRKTHGPTLCQPHLLP